MRLPTPFLVVALLGLVAVSSRAAEWPSGFQQLEKVALLHPALEEPVFQLRSYIRVSDRALEIQQRWEGEAKKAGPDAWRYQALVGSCVLANWDSAAAEAALRKATDLAPENAEAWLARGRFESAKARPEARESLERACQLSVAKENPGEALHALVSDHLARGRKEEALTLLAREYATAQNPAYWGQLMEVWGRTALAEGRLPAVLSQLEAAPGPEAAAALAGVYAGIKDFAMATAAMAKARAVWPKDPVLAQRSFVIARGAGDLSEVTRLMREQARAEPEAGRWCELFLSLVKIGATDEAARLLQAHPAELAGQAARWRNSLGEAMALGLAERLEAVLAQAPGSWEAVFTRAELAVRSARFPEASALFWSLFEAQFDDAPISSLAEERFAQSASYLPYNVFPSLGLTERHYRGSAITYPASEYFRPTESRPGAPLSSILTIQEARDFALVFLALIAIETRAEAPFQAELPAHLARLSGADRLLSFLLVGSGESMVQAVEAYEADAERTVPADTLAVAQMRKVETSAESSASLVKRAHAMAVRLPASGPKPGPTPKYVPDQTTTRTGAVRRPRSGDPYRECYDEFMKGNFKGMTDRFAAAVQETGDSSASLASATQSFALCLPKHRGDPKRLAEAAAAVIACVIPPTYTARKVDRLPGTEDLWASSQPGSSYGTRFPTLSNMPVRVYSLPKETQARLAYPPASLFAPDETTVLWTVFGETREPAVWAELKRLLAVPLPDATPERDLHLEVARLYLMWWNGEYDEARAGVQKLLDWQNEDGLRVGLAVMRLRFGQYKDAIATLEGLKRPYPGFAYVQKSWYLRMAAEAKDAEVVRSYVKELESAPLDYNVRRDLAATVARGGFAEEAQRLRVPLLAALEREEDWRKLSDALNAFDVEDRSPEAMKLAESILTPSPSQTRTESMSQRYRGRARSLLQQSGHTGEFLSKLRQKGLATDPLEYQWRLAELAPNGEEGQSAWRRVLELDPGNVQAAETLLNQTQPQDPQRWRMFEALLASRGAETIMTRNEQIPQAYLSAQQVPALVKRLTTVRFPGPVGRQGSYEDEWWRRLVMPLVQADEHEAAVAILRRALALAESPSSELQRLFAQELDAGGQTEELGRWLLALMAPETPVRMTPFFFREGRTVSRSGAGQRAGTISFDGTILALAQKAGVAGEARARLEKAAGDSPVARHNLVLLRVVEREADVLPELRQMVANPLRAEERAWLTSLAEELSGWPEADPVSQQLVAKLDGLLPRESDQNGNLRLALGRLAYQCDSRELGAKLGREVMDAARAEAKLMSGTMRSLRAVAEMAREAGDKAMLEACASAYTEWLGTLKPASGLDWYEGLRLVSLFLDDQPPLAEKILAGLRGRINAERESSMSPRLQLYADELAGRNANLVGYSPLVWLDADRSNEQQAVLVWDLALHRPAEQEAKYFAADRPLKNLDGKYAVELFFGERPDALRSLVRFPRANVRGDWQGALPSASGFMRVVYTRGAEVLTGAIVPVCTGRNLMREEANNGRILPKGFPSAVRGGPSAKGECVAYREQGAAYPSYNNVTLRRVPVQPGRDYVISGWLRSAGAQQISMSWRYLDAEGKELGSERAPDNSEDARYWSYHWVPISSGERQNAVSMPDGTAFLEPYFPSASAGFDLAGFGVLEVAPLDP